MSNEMIERCENLIFLYERLGVSTSAQWQAFFVEACAVVDELGGSSEAFRKRNTHAAGDIRCYEDAIAVYLYLTALMIRYIAKGN